MKVFRAAVFRPLGLLLLVTAAGGAMSGCSGSSSKKLSRADQARLYLEAAGASLADGDSTTALEHALRAERIDDSLAEVYHTKALIFLAKHDAPQALAEARKAVQRAPKDPTINNTLGKLLMDAGKPTEAVAPLLQSAQDPLNHESYKPWTNLGILHYRRMDFPKATEYLTRAIDASPTLACIAFYYRGHIEIQKGLLKGAIKDYEQATKRYCAGFADAHLALGIAYERSRQYDQARKIFLDIEDRFSSTTAAEQAMNHLKSLP